MRQAALFIASQHRQVDAGILSTLLQSVQQTVRSLINRRRVSTLADFDDHMLADIGLSRDDVRRALDLPFSHDPAFELQKLALRNRGRGWNV